MNKEELFAMLTDDVTAYEYPVDKEVYITSRQSVVSKCSNKHIAATDHEEADSRMCLRVADAL